MAAASVDGGGSIGVVCPPLVLLLLFVEEGEEEEVVVVAAWWSLVVSLLSSPVLVCRCRLGLAVMYGTPLYFFDCILTPSKVGCRLANDGVIGVCPSTATLEWSNGIEYFLHHK